MKRVALRAPAAGAADGFCGASAARDAGGCDGAPAAGAARRSSPGRAACGAGPAAAGAGRASRAAGGGSAALGTATGGAACGCAGAGLARRSSDGPPGAPGLGRRVESTGRPHGRGAGRRPVDRRQEPCRRARPVGALWGVGRVASALRPAGLCRVALLPVDQGVRSATAALTQDRSAGLLCRARQGRAHPGALAPRLRVAVRRTDGAVVGPRPGGAA